MSCPPPLLSNGHQPTAALADELAEVHKQLDEALNVLNGARAVLERAPDSDEQEDPVFHEALEAELRQAEDAVPRLECRMRELEVQIAAAVPTPLSPDPPLSARLNGFSQPSSPLFPTEPGMNGFVPTLSTSLPEPAEPDFQTSFDTAVDLLSRLGEMESVGERVRAMDSVVEIVERHQGVKFELRLQEMLSSITACLAESAGKETRAAVYRLLRHLVVDVSDVYALNAHHLPLFLIRSLARDTSHNLEKEHALRLIRALLLFTTPESSVSGGGEVEVVPVGVMRAVVAIAETPEEKLRLAALETLGELVIRSLPLLVLSGGLRVVLQSLLDGPFDLAPSLSLLLLNAMDHPSSRQWLRPGVDVEIVLAGFTEVQPKQGGEERVRACAEVVRGWLGSWSGLFYLNIHGRQALTSLVDSLSNPSQAIRETLLDMLFSVFNVKTPAWYSSRGATRSSFSAPTGFPDTSLPGAESKKAGAEERKTNLIDQYTAILLLVFIEAGLIEALASLAAEPKDPTTAKKVSLLIAEILELGNRVLPPQHAVRLQALPRLFALTSSFDSSSTRLAASEALLEVKRHDRARRVGELQAKTREAFGAGEETGRNRSNSLDDPLTRTNSQAAQVASTKLRTALQMDDITFRNQLLETGVLSTKDPSRWQFDILLQMLEGPLKNPTRLDEAMRASKFMRRLLAFFRPSEGRFAELPKDGDNIKWIRLGCTLISTLLTNPDGVQYLLEEKLVRQISDCLFQLDPQFGATGGADVLFSKERMETTLASGYFEMLGALTKTAEGVRVLDQFKVFTAFYRISELRSREDLVKAIIENVDYSIDGHSRVFLAKALTSSYKHIRLFATAHLASLLRLSTSSGTSPCPYSAEWQISLLVQQLYDSAPEVVALAVQVLEVACQERETLEMVVRMRPALDLLGDVAMGLLTKFLSTDSGVRYLHEINFIERELDEWLNERNLIYVVELELALAAALKTDGGLREPSSTFDGTPPSHFYGELVKTAEGCEILHESGHFQQFAEVIQQHAEVELDEPYIMTLKSVLWAVGHIGSTADGLALLDDEGVLTDMVQIAAFSPVYSLRGTATYALALVSQREEGAEMLDELGWESVYTPICGPTGICVPAFLGEFIYTPLWEPPLLDIPNSLLLASPTSHIERDALSALANLSNHILATKASKALAKLKTRHRSLFSSPSLFYRALDMLASHHYRLATRKYILELLDLPLDTDVAERIARAGEELKAKKRAELEGGEGEEAGVSERPQANGVVASAPRWATSGVDAILSGGIDGEATEDDESSADEAEATIPLKVLTPLVTVRGFLLA